MKGVKAKLILGAAIVIAGLCMTSGTEVRSEEIISVSEAMSEDVNEPLAYVRIIDGSDLTEEILTNRKGTLIIERCVGTVTTEQGDGKLLNPWQEGQDYISYARLMEAEESSSIAECNVAEVGDTVVTYFIYNPETNLIDDIVYRWDYVLSE